MSKQLRPSWRAALFFMFSELRKRQLLSLMYWIHVSFYFLIITGSGITIGSGMTGSGVGSGSGIGSQAGQFCPSSSTSLILQIWHRIGVQGPQMSPGSSTSLSLQTRQSTGGSSIIYVIGLPSLMIFFILSNFPGPKYGYYLYTIFFFGIGFGLSIITTS